MILAPLAAWIVQDEVAFFREQEAVGRDLETKLTAAVQGPRDRQQVALVRITDRDYEEIFGATSPLNADALQALLDAILAGNPRLVGVDLDTSDPTFRSLRVPEEWRDSIVWARGASYLCPCDAGDLSCGVSLPVDRSDAYRHCSNQDPASLRVLVPHHFRGGERNSFPWGLSLIPLDEDAEVRRYQRAIRRKLTPDSERGSYPTLALAIAALAQPNAYQSGTYRDDRRLFIHYRPLRQDLQMTAGEVLARAHEDSAYDSVLRGKVVLLGGTYWSARDAYFTPLGELPGVAVHGHLVETELAGGGKSAANGWLVLLGLVVGWAGLRVLLTRLPLDDGFRLAIPYIVASTLLWSWVLTGSWTALWPYFILVLGLQLFDHTWETVRVQAQHRVAAELGATLPALPRSLRPRGSTLKRLTSLVGGMRWAAERDRFVAAQEEGQSREQESPDNAGHVPVEED